MLPNDGVGLARMEFIVNEHIGIHPMALIHPEKIASRKALATIARLVRNYARPTDFFVEKLAEGVGTIAAAFYPRPVIVRLSDFKTNEYASLIGGAAFEPKEENPMLGFRGAARYSHPAYAAGFALECQALARVRNEMGLTNLRVMVPFCRRVAEAEEVIETMVRHGLKQGDNGLEIYVMCEIPNNVIQIDAFARLFDGFSIGSNDLTRLTLGVDRDSEIVAFDFDERDPGMFEMLRLAVTDEELAARQIIEQGRCEILVLSLGTEGALLVTADGCERFAAIPVEARGTVGAGDSMLAGIVLGLSRELPLRDAVRFGMAAGAAALLGSGTQLCRRSDVERLCKEVGFPESA